MKLLTSIIAAVATLVVAAAASATIPADGGYTDGLRVVYETPITSRSSVAHERYHRCHATESLRAPRAGRASKATRATTEKWCRFMPTVQQAPPADGPATDAPAGSILSVPLGEWTPL